ncbi:hypothetical protein Rmf_03790 [Roseomonas fluvialis]|uniref:HTH araC/xylS-type domain-containing protein n=1 Tax=Roseomonas fluvialis TaxID=1750527 RepID=A0ABM7XYC3_9PROT|nr:hypothetical protein Rmf_03790 [Roseomonas fluvialis]
MTLVRLPQIHMSAGEENLRRIVRACYAPDRIYFRLKRADEPTEVVDGREEVPQTVTVNQRGRPVIHYSSGLTRWRSISMSATELAARAALVLGRDLDALLRDAVVLHPAVDAFTRLSALQSDALRIAREAPDVLAHPTAAAALDVQLSEAVLAMLGDGTAVSDSAAQRRGHTIMRRADDFIEANATVPVSRTDLCRAAGSSARTLDMLFQERFGCSMQTYLRSRRLWMARRALIAGDPLHQTVTDIALGCGFWELGRFAVAYRHAFGERPSETLRRAAYGTSAAPTVFAQTA